MKQIWRIYTTDVRNVAKHWAAIVMVVGLMILPSLYAWFNIEASWDPYGNTNNIPIAVSNEDVGVNLYGKDINIGNEVVGGLKENDGFDWKFVDEKQAIHGVERGEYYASITIPKDFSEKITTILSDNPQKPEIDYFVNEKVNAITPKITIKGASGITEEVSKNFVKTVNGEIFKIFNELGIDLETSLPSIEKVKDMLFKIEAQFPEMYTLVDTALTDAAKAQELVKTAQDTLPTVENVIRDGQQMTKDLDSFLTKNNETLEQIPATVKQDLLMLKQGADGASQLTDFLLNPSSQVDFNQLNQEGYKAIAENVNDTVTGALGATRNMLDELQRDVNNIANNPLMNTEEKKAALQDYSNRIQGRIDAISSVIEFLQKLQEGAPTQAGKDFLGKRIDNLTKVQTKLVDIQKDLQAGIDAINKGEEIKQTVIDDLNKGIQSANDAVDTAEKDYNDTFVTDYQTIVGAVDDVKNKGINGLDSSKEALTILNARFTAMNQMIDDILPVLQDVNKIASDVNSSQNLNGTIDTLNQISASLEKGIDATNVAIQAINQGQQPAKDVIESINAVSKDVSTKLDSILARYDSEIVPSFNEAIARTKRMSADVTKILGEANSSIPDVKKLLEDASKGLVDGTKTVEDVKAEMPATEQKIKELANKIREFESQEDVNEIIRLLKNDFEQQSDYVANPVDLKENKLFAMPNYGSAMSPFYTVLALWVGALLMVSLLTVEVHEEGVEYKSYQIYFGRFLTFLTIGLAQAFIVSMGDIFLLGTYVADKFWFVLFSLFISAVFVCIVYSLVSVFGNVGKSLAIILLVLQVAGSGGTFPIQMLPNFFQAIYPFLPFTYAISVIRETVGGMIWDIVIIDLLALSVFVVIMLVLALVLKTRINKSSEKFVENAKGSKIIH